MTAQIEYLVEAVNTSARRAAMLRDFSEDPVTAVPQAEAEMLTEQEVNTVAVCRSKVHWG